MKEVRLISCKEAASRWDLTERWVSILCKTGKIPGAVKVGHYWKIPEDTEKPRDSRIKTGAYIKEAIPKNLPLPLGVSDYKRVSKEYYYIDKTGMLKDIIDKKPLMTLFLRPARFGKSLALSMIKTYFEKTEENTSSYFTSFKIWQSGSRYRSEQGKYPVIYLNMKDINYPTYEASLSRLLSLIRREYSRHTELLHSDACSAYQRSYYENIMKSEMGDTALTESLVFLSEMLNTHHGTAPILLIDEYDTPIKAADSNGYGREMRLFLKHFFGNALKDNSSIHFAMLFGTEYLGQEEIFSELENMLTDSVYTSAFAEYFGFTQEETSALCNYYNIPEDLDLVSWYGGYQIGKHQLVSPQSILSYIQLNNGLMSYRSPAMSTELISRLIQNASPEFIEKFRSLMLSESIPTVLEPFRENSSGDHDGTAFISSMISSGCLTVSEDKGSVSKVKIPNLETLSILRKTLLSELSRKGYLSDTYALQLRASFARHEKKEVQSLLKSLLLDSVSRNTYSSVKYLQLIYLGLSVIAADHYRVEAARDSSNGRFILSFIDQQNPSSEIRAEVSNRNMVKIS